MDTKTYRRPEALQVFVSGVNYDIGRWSEIGERAAVALEHSAYSDDPLFAVFRYIDFAFIVRFVLSLFALLFTYNAVSGEREDGTLKLIMSNPVPRATYLLAKGIGAWLGLVLPIGIPILLSLLVLPAFGIVLTGDQWARVAALMAVSLLLFSFFIVVGVFVSSVTKRSSLSFLISLVVWILVVMIVPGGGVMAAGTMVPVPRLAEIEARKEAFARDQWHDHFFNTEHEWAGAKASCGSKNLSEEEMWAMIEKQDSARLAVERKIDEYGLRLQEDLRQRRRVQEKLAFALSRFSPASDYQLAAMTLAETDIETKTRYEDAMVGFRDDFLKFTREKSKESGDIGGIRISMTMGDEGKEDVQISADRGAGELDLTGLPQFEHPQPSLAESMSSVVIDAGLIGLMSLLAFAGAFVAFLKYDVR
jgi:ABC-type transport system involved in multi-copper enzyme maturation permease subunit